MGALTLRGSRLVTPMLVVPVLCLTLAACARRSGESGHSGRHEPVAGAASHPKHADGVWGLDVVSRGSTVDLLVATAEAGVVRLLHQRSSDGGRSWSTPVPVPAGELAPAHGHRGADPQIAAAGDRLLVAWTARGDSSWGTGPIGTAVSDDGGRSWAPGATPSDDGSRDGHGFLDLAATADGAFQAVWLDGRDGDGQGLRFASSPDGRAWSPNVTVDRATCECCWNRLVSRGGATSVIYRDTSPRDLRVASSSDGGAHWEDRGTPGGFDWSIDACPHVGGALAFAGGGAVALDWTGEEESAGLHVVQAEGESWRPPVRLGGPSARHADLVARGDELIAVWDETAADSRAIFTARSADSGQSWSQSERVARSEGGSHPLTVAVDEGVLVIWTSALKGHATWASALFD